MARTPQEVFESLAQAFASGDLEKMVDHYTDDCIQIWNGHALRGKAGARQGFADFLSELGDLKTYEEPVKVFEDDVLFLVWWADLGDRRCDGVDTLLFQDGLIKVHTVKYDMKER